MIPLQLTVQGLYSYQEAQTIDFEQLTGSQLFGIFGAVGSGKSSVLEAIVFVLYDRSERLNKSGDNRYYNMLNLRSPQFVIDFTFRVAAPQPIKYRFAVVARRKKKDPEKVDIKERRYYRWAEGDWQPIEVADPASVVGMTYENFMQTVIIPQGKFREFIDRRPNDRTQMLKELFRLEKFDLSYKTSHLLAEVRSTITDLEARLSEIGTVTSEETDAVRREVAELEVSLQENKALLDQSEVVCRAYERLEKLFAERAAAQEQFRQLLGQQADYQAREKQLHAYREAELYFNSRLEQWASIIKEQNEAQQSHQRLLAEIKQQTQQQDAAHAAWETARQDYEGRDTIRAQCTDLENLLVIHQSHRDLATWQAEAQRAREAHEQLDQQVAAHKQQLKALDAKLATAEQNWEEQTTLHDVFRWHQQQAEYEAEGQRRAQEVATQQQVLQTIDDRKGQLLTEYEWRENGTFDRFFQHLEARQETVQEESRRALRQLGQLQARAQLLEQAQHLVAGEACPLCGATHHPAVAHPGPLAQQTADTEATVAQLQAQAQRYETLAKAMRCLQREHQEAHGRLEGLVAQQQTIRQRTHAHTEAFVWETYRAQEASAIAARVQQADQQRAEQKKLRQQRTDAQAQQEQAEHQLQAAQQRWQQAQEELRRRQSKVESYRAQLRVLAYERFQHRSEAELRASLEKGQAKLEQAAARYEATRRQHQEGETRLGILTARQEDLAARQQRLAQQAAAAEREVQDLCQEKSFDDVDHVRAVLELQLDKDVEQAAIFSYQNRLHLAQNEVKRLEQEIRQEHYDPRQHREADATCTRLRSAIEQMHEARVLALRTIREHQQKQEKTRQLSQRLVQQQHREDQLKTLASLFRGSGFVNYASTVLLRDVCQAANVRFRRLTRNHLSLELNGDNDFIVRDYLNDGKTRLLKTLSGGQTFQAALCLALALAENIKSLNQAEQSFFFLDEGFGSLDKASLRIVFDTLKSLRQENRIVGIISHVEELQQEIDVYLKIEHDRERGSLVRGSWE